MAIFGRDSSASASSSSPRSSMSTRSSIGHKRYGDDSSHTSFSSKSSTGNTRRRSLLHRTPEDPSIMAAREQVARAETAEQEADRALVASRRAVKEARDHVKHLEREAAEEIFIVADTEALNSARLARIKHDQAKSISKRAKPLGRHL
ncbi:uncharacterized protein N7484_011014 [Penicillium longicatenatum]|uniref:uncharacterized protein n=1 Tax=Penicillium longicatenatum TaxID=1561947 RepID=UPI0025474412|nr:uncharacterized protein N7484_011014 [Penicillium longicatenatum]KAJ5630914.1 hypothetical protein N7484_011014 [Penicillium longicatenatum]